MVVLDWSSINDIDYSACVELMSIVKEYKANNILFIQVRLLLVLLHINIDIYPPTICIYIDL